MFCVPGESFPGLLDGLHDHTHAIRIIACRHEAGATDMAEACGKLAGRPGIAAVTRGRVATNGVDGLHAVFQDSTPRILFLGQVSRDHMNREAFSGDQLPPHVRSDGEAGGPDRGPARIPEYVSRTWATALPGRPGPVAPVLPKRRSGIRPTSRTSAPTRLRRPRRPPPA